MAGGRESLSTARTAAAGRVATAQAEHTRDALMARHLQARQRRDSAPLGSDEYRAAAEEVGRIEIAIAALVEDRPVPG